VHFLVGVNISYNILNESQPNSGSKNAQVIILFLISTLQIIIHFIRKYLITILYKKKVHFTKTIENNIC